MFPTCFLQSNFSRNKTGAFGSFLFRALWWTWKFLAFSIIFARGAGFDTDGADGTWWVFRDRIGLVAVEVWSATWASVCSCSLIQAQDRPEDEPCFASNMLTCLNPNVFPLPLAFPPRRNRVDAALSMLSVSHMRCGETKADNISKETCSSHCQKFS